MKALRFFFLGKPGKTGLIRWEFHLWILMALMFSKAVAGVLETVGRLLSIKGQHVPWFVAAAGPYSDIVFWPTAFLFLYLFAAVIPVRVARTALVKVPEA